MSILGRALRATGLYDRMQQHFFDTVLVPYVNAGQISAEESKFLGQLASSTAPDRPIIEIGTLFGRSTFVLAINKEKDQKLISVDRYSWNPCGFSDDKHRDITRKFLEKSTHNLNVHLVDQDKNDFYESYSGPVPSMVFFDADHSYEATKADIEWGRSVGALIICGHDYNKSMPGVVEAVDESGGIAQLVDTLWVLK